jgi:hypothetical protein
MRELQKCRQLTFQCPIHKTWESVMFFIRAGSYITAVSPHFLLQGQEHRPSEKGVADATDSKAAVSTIWILENSVGTFLKTLMTPQPKKTENSRGSVWFVGIQETLRGYRVNLLSESGSYSEMMRYVRDQRYQRRTSSIVAVSPPIPGRSLCVYILRNEA